MTQKKQQPDAQPIAAEEISPQTAQTTDVIGENEPMKPEEATVAVTRSYGYWILTLFVVFTGSLVSVSWYGWKLFQTNAARMDGLMATQQTDQRALSQSLQNTQDQLAQLNQQLT
ncbi:MAG: hypothetical protein IE913_04680, partial [Halothiobacillus sp.]|nr:hypothetical protein [Halothiobacillus sp.]